jgi:type II secretory pathway pseudopilin PulG
MPALRRAHSGFTSIELLVSVGVVALLTAVLVPSLHAARDAAKTTRYLANLRQWARPPVRRRLP